MRNALRHTSIFRLALACAAVVAIGAGAAVAATAGSGPVPPPASLPAAVHDALSAPRTAGVSADVTVTNGLLPGSVTSGQGQGSSSPLLSGGSGRIWMSADGRVRLEVQSSRGDAEIYLENGTLSYYDAANGGTLYRLNLGSPRAGGVHRTNGQSPSMSQIQQAIDRVTRHASVTGPTPTDVNGQAAYEVRVAPLSHGGLIGGAALWWDANHGVPLRISVYATGNRQPVLDITASNVSFGAVDPSVFQIPPAAHTVDAALPQGNGGHGTRSTATVTDVQTLRTELPFTLSAPPSLDGRTLASARLITLKDGKAALLTYGQGLDGIAVVESQAKAHGQGSGGNGGSSGLSLPTFKIGATTATELPTALGTLVYFDRAGVTYALLGSVTPADAQQAAAGL